MSKTGPLVKDIKAVTKNIIRQHQAEGWDLGGVWERLKREGIYVYLWLIHVVVWQKPTQHRKATILQLKINVKK